MKTKLNLTCHARSKAIGATVHTVSIIALLAGWSASAATLYVWQDNPNPAWPFDSWGNAATNIQDAVGAAKPGDLVLVTNGVYATGGRALVGTMTNRAAIDKAITVQGVNGPDVTVIEGTPAANGYNGDGAIRCVYLATNAVLSGFTLTNGYTDVDQDGGGVLCANSATVTNCVITGNSSGFDAGGAVGGTLYNCILSGNWSYYDGGGACLCTLYNCTLSGNSAWSGGGACACTLYNCTLSGNSASDGGGASASTLYNCVLVGNRANGNYWGYSGFGGGADWSTLYNCTVTRNSASGGIPGIDAGGGVSGSTLNNCIVYFNTASSDPNYSSSTFNYSCTSPLPSEGLGNTDADPQLASFTHLSTSSPCLGAGSSAYATGLDIDAEPWAVPPCMGADQLTVGQATGALSMFIEAEHTNIATDFSVQFVAKNEGSILTSVWDFGDGTVATNRAIISHAWSVPGNYTVRLTGYNDSFPGGVIAAVEVEVSDTIFYVNQENPSPAFPYTNWATAATQIQAAIEAGPAVGRLVLVTNGVYASGGVAMWGNNRIALTDAVRVRSINGPEATVIEGAKGVRCAYLGSNAILSGFTLTQGNENRGGGAWCESSGTLTNCIITGNSATGSSGEGGGTYNGEVFNCILTDNSAANAGGGAYKGTLYNCILTGNSASTQNLGGGGGGAYGSALYNCTVTYNSVFGGTGGNGSGGGVYGGTLYNCIVYFNTASSDLNYSSSTFNYSCSTPLPPGPGNIAADPQLATLTHLSSSSPCLGAGSSAYTTGVDIDGEPWAEPPCMGVDQLTPSKATGALSMSLEAEYTNVATGFAVRLFAGNQGPILASVWDFGDGTFLTNQAIATHTWNVPGAYTVSLTGYNDSFPGGVMARLQVAVTESKYYVNQANPTPVFPYTSWTTAARNLQDAIGAGTTIGRLVLVTNGVYASGSVAAEGNKRTALTDAVRVQSVNGPQVTVIQGATGIRCAYVGTYAVLSGFTLTKGNSSYGGGAWCENSAILTNCMLTGNSSPYEGGGAYGGTLYNCVVTDNSAIYSAGGSGGGSSHGTLYNCILSGNSSWYGGGVRHGTLYNCTLIRNEASDSGGGEANSTLYNCIVYFNNALQGPNDFGGTLYYSCTTPLPSEGTGNITNAPLFVDLAAGNLHLRYGSAGIDAGSNLSAFIITDLDGHLRPLDGDGDGYAAFDMGAYEFDARSLIPPDWFTDHGLDPADPQVASGNPDHDAFTTFQEWLADTDPTNSLSFFHIESISKQPPAMISFQSSSDRTYTLWGTPQLAPPNWTPVPGQQAILGTGGTMTLGDSTNAPQQFYRVEVSLP